MKETNTLSHLSMMHVNIHKDIAMELIDRELDIDVRTQSYHHIYRYKV